MTIDLNLLAQAIIAGLVLWAIKGIHRINGSVTSLMTWKGDHEKIDDERHSAIIDWLKQLDRRKP